MKLDGVCEYGFVGESTAARALVIFEISIESRMRTGETLLARLPSSARIETGGFGQRALPRLGGSPNLSFSLKVKQATSTSADGAIASIMR